MRFRLRRATLSMAMVFGRSPENSVGRSLAPKVFASNVSVSIPGVEVSLESRAESDASIAGARRGANQNWYGVADRFPFMACPGASKVVKSKLRFLCATGVIVLDRKVTWVIIEPSTVRPVTARCRLSIQAIVRSFTVSLSGFTPNRGGSAKCAKCGNRSQELNPRPAMSPRRHGPRLARRSSRVHRAFPATVVDSSLA